MTSQAQRVANFRNAQLSTGPATGAGKRASSQNSRKHGLLSREVLLPDEDALDLHAFRLRLRRSLRPKGEFEGLLFDRIASSAWRLRRALRIEADAFVWSSFDYDGKKIGAIGSFLSLSAKCDAFSKISRYESAIERTLYRALHELQRLQAERAGQPVTPPVTVDLDVAQPGL
jgi:hypothetical protein